MMERYARHNQMPLLTPHIARADLRLADAAQLSRAVVHVAHHAPARRCFGVQGSLLPEVAAKKLLVQGLRHLVCELGR